MSFFKGRVHEVLYGIQVNQISEKRRGICALGSGHHQCKHNKEYSAEVQSQFQVFRGLLKRVPRYVRNQTNSCWKGSGLASKKSVLVERKLNARWIIVFNVSRLIFWVFFVGVGLSHLLSYECNKSCVLI